MSKSERVDTNETAVIERPWFLKPIDQISQELQTDVDSGLKHSQIKSLQEKHGPNQLADGGGVNPWSILAGQVFNAMVLVLILAFAVSMGIRSWIEGGVIAAVIIINIVVGFFQEYSSAKTMDSLRSLASPTAHVVRDGKVEVIPSAEVTVGDLVEVKTGDVLPADLRLVEAMNFETDEALLTGESMPVAKDADASWGKEEVDPRDVGVGDRINMAYSSSTVTKGRARGIVIAIGMQTEIGAIAESLRGGDTKVRKVRKNEDGKAPFHRYVSAYALTVTDNIGSFLGVNKGTPLQRTLSWLAIILFFIAVVFALVVFAANRFDTRQEIAIYAVATGVSMIPASLVVVLTLTLAGGTRAMVARNVIVRKLDSLEAVGAVTTICSDKTGTLTMGKMIVRAAWIPSKGTITVGETSEAFNPNLGDVSFSKDTPLKTASDKSTQNKPRDPLDKEDIVKTSSTFEMFLNIASMCNIAKVIQKDDGWNAQGDPTECAIQVFVHRFDWGREKLTKSESPAWKQLAEYPFDSDLKRMSVLYRRNNDGKQFAFMKGAVERIFEASKEIVMEEGPRPLDETLKAEILDNVEALASQGLRVLALAYRPWEEQIQSGEQAERAEVEKDMTILGLVGIYDPPRPETKGSVRECHEAGIEVRMCTGDHVATARAIALQVGILPRNMHTLSKEVTQAMVKTAAEFDRMTDEEIDALPLLPLVLARCAPSTKVRMVDALHRRSAYVAMTGDGVNDAPALKRADVGVAMGMNGSDVAKDAADIVLTDDNFSSIVAAVEEGRRLFDNIQKFVLHLLAQNVAQACVLLIGLAFKDANDLSVFPIAPIPILYIIMVTSSLPAIGLGLLNATPGIMKRPPVKLTKVGIFQPELLFDMMVYGILGAGFSLAAFGLIVYTFNDGDLGIDSNNTRGNGSDPVFRARSACFAVLVFFSLWLAVEVIHSRRSAFYMTPHTPRPWTQWIRDIYREKFIFWTVVFGFASIFPLIYIPGLNDVVLKQLGITWEMGLAFICFGCVIVTTELWKWSKRVYFRHHKNEQQDASERMFAMWETTMTQDV